MCRGIQEANQSGFCLNKDTSGLMSCELCGLRASLFCQADNAFLCRKCDKSVHEANFLALRHVRCFLCNACQNLTHRYLIGVSAEVLLPTMVSSIERRLCNSKVERNCSGTIKKPLQFL